jgi:hypothetical protein
MVEAISGGFCLLAQAVSGVVCVLAQCLAMGMCMVRGLVEVAHGLVLGAAGYLMVVVWLAAGVWEAPPIHIMVQVVGRG